MELSLGFCDRCWPILGSMVVKYLGVRRTLSSVSASTYLVLCRMPPSPGEPKLFILSSLRVVADLFVPILLIAKVELSKL